MFAGIAGSVVIWCGFVMPETLASDLRKSLSVSMLNPVSTQIYALRLVARDPVLILFCLNYFMFFMLMIGTFSTRTSYLLTVGFSMEETLLPETVSSVLQLPMGMLMMQILPRIGAINALFLNYVLWVFAMAFIGPYVILFGHLGAYISSIFLSAAVVLGMPASATLISERVERDHQSKCSAALAMMGSLGAIVGTPLYSRVLFKATHRGMAKATPMFASMLLAACCAGVTLTIMALIRSSPPPGTNAPAVKCAGTSSDESNADDGAESD